MTVPPVIIGAPTITNDSLPVDIDIWTHDSLTEALVSLALLGALHSWTPRRLSFGLPYSEAVDNLARELVSARSKSRGNPENELTIGSPVEELS
jgi:hypothetical protein